MRKSFVICAPQLAGGELLKMIKYFEVMLTFSNSPACNKFQNLDLVIQKKVFVNCPIVLLVRDNETKLVPVFSFILDFLRKESLALKSIVIILF